MLLIDGVVAGQDHSLRIGSRLIQLANQGFSSLRRKLLLFQLVTYFVLAELFTLFQLGDDAIDFVILVGGFLASAGNNQRGAGFVDQDGIDFVNDREIVAALHTILDVELHVVAQVVESEFVVGAVGYVGGVGGAPFLVVEVVHNYANREAEKAIELAHPFGIAFRQIIVDRDHVHAAPAERVEIYRKRRDQGFAFAGLHF